MGLVDPNSPRIPPPTPEPSAEEAPWIQRDGNGGMVECTDENADVP